MAHLDRISQDLPAVAREIGRFVDLRFERGKLNSEIPPERQKDSASLLELTETLTIWGLRSEVFEALSESRITGDVVEWATQEPFLHHQIRLRGKTVGFARSHLKRRGGKDLVFQISDESSYAIALSQLFEKLDKEELSNPFLETDPVVRLLEIPAYQVFVLWLLSDAQQESRVMAVSAAERYAALVPGLLLTSEQFFQALITDGPLTDVTLWPLSLSVS